MSSTGDGNSGAADLGGDGASGPAPLEIAIDARRWIRAIVVAFVAAEALVVFCDYYMNYANMTGSSGIRRLFNITREDSVASWLSITQTTLVAVTLWAMFVLVRRQGATRWRAGGWLVLALFFSYMSMDDGSKFHERVGSAFFEFMKSGAETSEPTSLLGRAFDLFPSYSWQFVFLPFFGALGLFTMLFLWRELDRPRARVLIIVAISCFVFAVGLDFIEGLEAEHDWNLYTRIAERVDLDFFSMKHFGEAPFRAMRHFSKSVEEFTEMLGTTIMWAVFLAHLARTAGHVQVRFLTGPDSGG